MTKAPETPPASRKEMTMPSQQGTSYAPPASVLKRLVTFAADKSGKSTATMPAEVFTRLLEEALRPGFDEAAYLEENSDIMDGVKSGRIPSGLRHFALHGYFEGRASLNYDVDEKWYLETYPDVKKAISAGVVVDAKDHFKAFGYAEGRVPSPRYQRTIGEWMTSVAGSKKS